MLPSTSFLKNNLWRPLNHPVAYHCLLKQGFILYRMQQVVAFVKTLTESDKDVTGYVNLLELNVN